MTETWLELANHNRTMAQHMVAFPDLVRARRSVANRAYYAAYAKVTSELIRAGYTPPVGREGPSHSDLRGRLIGVFFSKRYPKDWHVLRDAVAILYDLRAIADYRPSVNFDEADARTAVHLMKRVFNFF